MKKLAALLLFGFIWGWTNPSPVLAKDCQAGFVYSVNGNLVQFYDSSFTGSATEVHRKWFFGDGTFSDAKNPSHQYNAPGEYNVCLVLKTPSCTDTVCQVIKIQSGGSGNCEAKFAWQKQGNKVWFANQSNTGGKQASYKWSFGDGTHSTEMNPMHEYAGKGKYEVCLIITTDVCKDTLCKLVEIFDAPNSSCKAQFSFDMKSGGEVVFKDYSAGAQHWFWDFGDGQSSTQQNPVHHYKDTTKGYKVCLTIKSKSDTDSCINKVCKEVFWKAPEPLCKARFEYQNWYDSTGNDTNFVVKFHNVSMPQNTGTSYWSFGDGHTSTERNPVHTYKKEGIYVVCLVITTQNPECSDSICSKIEVKGKPNTIQGFVYYDANCNKVKDPGENFMEKVKIVAEPGGYVTWSGPQGYILRVGGPGTYTVKAVVPESYKICRPDSPWSYKVTFTDRGQHKGDNHFGLRHKGNVRDLKVHVHGMGKTRPGKETYYAIEYANRGSQVESGLVKFSWSPNQSFVEAGRAPDSSSLASREIFWKFQNLQPGASDRFKVVLRVDSGAQLGDSLEAWAWVKPITDDIHPQNNESYWKSPVKNSFDPNDKLVTPKGADWAGFIGMDPIWLNYTVRFQNTGNDTAYLVRIYDELDLGLDLSTLEVLASSHNMSWDVQERSLSFTFSAIQLPDSATDPIGSNGFVAFRIKPRAGQTQGTELLNSAAIYFDLNEPVITNTVRNTIGLATGIRNVPFSNDQVLLYPNPAQSVIYLKSSMDEPLDYFIRDARGRIMLEGVSVHEGIQVGDLDPGMYWIHLEREGNPIAVKAFIRE